MFTLLFSGITSTATRPIGRPRSYGSVCGTTGVPLRLDLAAAKERYLAKYGHRRGDRNLYRFFVNDQEPEILDWMRAGAAPMSEAEIRHFFVEHSDLLERATPAERMYLQSRYLSYDFNRVFLDAELAAGPVPKEQEVRRW